MHASVYNFKYLDHMPLDHTHRFSPVCPNLYWCCICVIVDCRAAERGGRTGEAWRRVGGWYRSQERQIPGGNREAGGTHAHCSYSTAAVLSISPLCCLCSELHLSAGGGGGWSSVPDEGSEWRLWRTAESEDESRHRDCCLQVMHVMRVITGAV